MDGAGLFTGLLDYYLIILFGVSEQADKSWMGKMTKSVKPPLLRE